MIRHALVLSLSCLLAAGSTHAGETDVEPQRSISGGHWHAQQAEGTYRIVTETVGYEHLSCRVWIEWLPAAGATPVARVPVAEISDGFWSCGSAADDLSLSDDMLSIKASHAYSHEPRVFTLSLGAPGNYQLQP